MRALTYMQMDTGSEEMDSRIQQLAEKLEQQAQELEQGRLAMEGLRMQLQQQAQGPSSESFSALQHAFEVKHSWHH